MGDESSSPTAAAPSAAKQQTTQDLLADIFGSNDETPAAPSVSTPSATSAVDDIMGLFGQTSLSPQPTGASSSSYSAPPSASADLFSSLSSSPAAVAATPPPAPTPAAAAAPQQLEAYNSNGLKITLTPQRDSSNRLVVNILARFTATQPVQSVNFQAAVPKVSPLQLDSVEENRAHLAFTFLQTQKLQMLAMSKTDVSPGATETQQLRVMVAAPGVGLLPLFSLSRAARSLCRARFHRLSSGYDYASPTRSTALLSRTRPTSVSPPVLWLKLFWPDELTLL